MCQSPLSVKVFFCYVWLYMCVYAPFSLSLSQLLMMLRLPWLFIHSSVTTVGTLMAEKALLRRLRSHWTCTAISSSTSWTPYAAVARHSTAGKNGTVGSGGGVQRHSKSSRKTGALRKITQEALGASVSVAECSAVAEPHPQKQQQKRPACEKITTTSHPSLWSPNESDYEALVENLLLYRRESIEPVLNALKKERALFDESVKKLETRVAEMYAVREEIREMLQNGAAAQRQALSEALRAAADSDGLAKEENETSADTSEEDEEISI
ncbi:kinesin, putative [Trypanosoma cruzi marinkellei]|uniref:Kinesin, putative n=1 Tax=Trypanosoma cruzi marinkellei TaxID=85056 RepID=K2MWE8_TRYCR|nr:kinesin, putative [Trypanosoma cruzi marinkellei]